MIFSASARRTPASTVHRLFMPRRESSLEGWQLPDDRDNPSLEPRDDRSPAFGFCGSSRGHTSSDWLQVLGALRLFLNRQGVSQVSTTPVRTHGDEATTIYRVRRRTDTTYGARAGNRTLNLGIKSLSTLRLREDQGGSARLNRTWIYDATVSGSLLEYQGVSRPRCQIRYASGR
jgi:hypothetical protein